jgi:endoglucanase
MKKRSMWALSGRIATAGLALVAVRCASSEGGSGSDIPEFGGAPPGGVTTSPGAAPGATPAGTGAPGGPGGTPAGSEGNPVVGGMVDPGAAPGAPGAGTPGTGTPGTPVGSEQPGQPVPTDPGQPTPEQPGGPLPVARDLSCGGINVAASDVISDFSTAQPIMYPVGTRGGTAWETFAATPASDPISPGNAFQVDPTQSGPCNSGGSLHVASPGNTGYGVGFGINFRTDAEPGKTALYDAAADGYTGIGFWAQCSQEVESVFMKVSDDATDFDVVTPRCSYDGAPPLTTLCRQYGIKNNVLLSGQWAHYEMYFGEALLDTDAVIAGTGVHPNALTAFQIQLNSLANAQPNGFDCFVDDVHFLRTPTPRAAAPRNVTTVNGHTIAPGGYYTEGNQIFDSTGAVHVFKGIARPSFEFDPAGIGITREDIQRMRAKGANVIRYSLSEGYWLSTHPQFNRNYQAYVDRAVQWTLQSGMDAIIDLHWSGSPVADQEQMASRQSITFWQQVAQKYAGDGRVIFELYNEPHDVSATVWRNGDGQFAGMQEMYNAVRTAGANNLVLAGGLDFAYNLESVLPAQQLAGVNIGYVTHPYRFKNPPPPQGYDGVAASVPIVATEFGDADVGGIGPNDCGTATYTSSIDDFTRRGMSWTAWAWTVAESRCAFPSLIDKYDGTPTPPGQVVFQAMQN